MQRQRVVGGCVLGVLAGAGLLVGAIALAHEGHGADALPPFVAPIFNAGLAGDPALSFDASGVGLYSWLPLGLLAPGADSANTCWGYTSPSGREYAIIGVSTGTVFVEVTDPGDAQVVAVLAGPTSVWRDMKVFGTRCYAVSEGGGGIQVFDLSLIDSGTVSQVGSVTTGGTQSTHTIFINEESGYLYRCGGGNTPVMGLRIYDLNADPVNPPLVGQWNNRYVHETQVVNWTTGPFAGREVAFAFANDSSGGGTPRVEILDVTNKASITSIAAASYGNAEFCHQGWLSTDRKYLFVDDELDESAFSIFSRTRVIDVQNLAAPFEAGTFESGAPSIDHNQYTVGNMLFQSNYRSGLRVFDATNPLSPTQIAYFDTFPNSNSANFNGLWNNYPFFPSGTVIGSDIERGLFVWRLGDRDLDISFPDGVPALLDADGDSFRVLIAAPASAPGNTVEPGSAKLRFNAGAGDVEVPLTHVSGDEYLATLPALACETEVRFFVTARSGAGVTIREPDTAPTGSLGAVVATTLTSAFDDSMETNTGWFVGATDDDATAGIWVRANPVGTGAQPEDDNPAGTGTLCWITGNGTPGGGIGAADLDGGTTTLTSPLMDATALTGTPFVSYYRWYSNDQGADPNSDSMPVEISNDNGANWTQLELVTENAGAWVHRSFRVADFVSPTDQIRIRFRARDLSPGSIVEAGVDDVRLEFVVCAPPPASCPGNANGDGLVDFQDISSVLANWGADYGGGTGPGDADESGVVNFDDVTSVLTNWLSLCK